VIHLPLLTVLSMSPLPIPASSTVGLEAAPTSSERHVAFRVESKALLEHQVADVAEDTTYFVRTDGAKALTETHGVRVVDDPSAPVIIVSLSWVSYPKSIYGVRIEAARSGKPPELVESFECTCGDSALTAAVIARFPTALEQLETREPAPSAPALEQEPEPAEPIAMTSDRPNDEMSRKPLGGLGRAGISVAVVGAAALVSGGIVFAQGRRPEQPPGQFEERDGKNFKPPGIALMVTGGAALVTGVVLLVVDRSKARRSSSALVLPSPGGLVLTGRF
jgi:hypothetical protein